MINFNKFSAAALSATVMATVLSPSLTRATNLKVWNLQYFDENEQLVGSGQFSYDLDTTTAIERVSCVSVECRPKDLTPEDPSYDEYEDPNYYETEIFNVKTALTSFSAMISVPDADEKLVEFSWTLDDNTVTQAWLDTVWWNDPSVPIALGYQWTDIFYDEIGPQVEVGRWIWGSRYESFRYFEMDSAQLVSGQEWQGSWSVRDFGSCNYCSGDGTWTARAVPEPLTILGVGTALGFGVAFKRRLAAKARQ